MTDTHEYNPADCDRSGEPESSRKKTRSGTEETLERCDSENKKPRRAPEEEIAALKKELKAKAEKLEAVIDELDAVVHVALFGKSILDLEDLHVKLLNHCVYRFSEYVRKDLKRRRKLIIAYEDEPDGDIPEFIRIIQLVSARRENYGLWRACQIVGLLYSRLRDEFCDTTKRKAQRKKENGDVIGYEALAELDNLCAEIFAQAAKKKLYFR